MMTDQPSHEQNEFARLVKLFFPTAVEVGTWTPEPKPAYACQDCGYFEDEGAFFPNFDDTEDLWWCTWCIEHGKSPLGDAWDQFEEDPWEVLYNEVWR